MAQLNLLNHAETGEWLNCPFQFEGLHPQGTVEIALGHWPFLQASQDGCFEIAAMLGEIRA